MKKKKMMAEMRSSDSEPVLQMARDIAKLNEQARNAGVRLDSKSLGKTVGIHIATMEQMGHGDIEGFIKGFKKGCQAVTGEVPVEEIIRERVGGMSQPSNEGAVAPPPKPEMKDYYDSSDPRGCSMSEYNAWQADLRKWEQRYGKKTRV